MDPLNENGYHMRTCGFCGCLINERNTASYRAVSTKSGPITKHTNVTFDSKTNFIRADSFTSSSVAWGHNPPPNLYLIHTHCLHIFQSVYPNLDIPLRYVIASATPVRRTNAHHCHRLSDLDAAAFVTNFNPVASPNAKDCLDVSSSLIRRVQELPFELYMLILSYCQLDLALAMTASEHCSAFMQLVRQDVARTRIAVCIQAAPLVRPGTQQEIFTEKVVSLTEKMKATFVRIAGKDYLQDIGRELSSTDAVDFTIPRGLARLALLVDTVGILNIAFRASAKGPPDWIRPDTRRHNIVLDSREFAAIRIVSDPIKCHMISPDLPGHNTGYPRPILPCTLGNWAPFPAALVDRSFPAPTGYTKASYIEFYTLDEVYLLFDPSQVLIGIFTEAGEGRVAISLKRNATTVVTIIQNWDKRTSLQIKDSNGQLLPVIKNPLFHEIETRQCRGIWFVSFEGDFIFNIF